MANVNQRMARVLKGFASLDYEERAEVLRQLGSSRKKSIIQFAKNSLNLSQKEPACLLARPAKVGVLVVGGKFFTNISLQQTAIIAAVLRLSVGQQQK